VQGGKEEEEEEVRGVGRRGQVRMSGLQLAAEAEGVVVGFLVGQRREHARQQLPVQLYSARATVVAGAAVAW
jgi:hypothetical protein